MEGEKKDKQKYLPSTVPWIAMEGGEGFTFGLWVAKIKPENCLQILQRNSVFQSSTIMEFKIHEEHVTLSYFT